MSDADRQSLRRTRLLGRGLASEPVVPGFMALGRDLRLAPGPSGVDFARVEGLAALTQDLEVALTTRLGSDVFNTQFGFDGLDALADEVTPLLIRERVRIAVIAVLRRDARVAQILDVTLDGGFDRPPAGGRTLDVRVAFRTTSGDEASLAVRPAL